MSCIVTLLCCWSILQEIQGSRSICTGILVERKVGIPERICFRSGAQSLVLLCLVDPSFATKGNPDIANRAVFFLACQDHEPQEVKYFLSKWPTTTTEPRAGAFTVLWEYLTLTYPTQVITFMTTGFSTVAGALNIATAVFAFMGKVSEAYASRVRRPLLGVCDQLDAALRPIL